MTKEKALSLLKAKGFDIYPSDQVMIYSKKDDVSVICSFLGSNTTVSISFSGIANLKKAKKLMQDIFGYAFEHLSDCPVDGKTANYFSIKPVN